jgi:hypothetical protein
MLAAGQRSQPLRKVEPSTRSGAEWRALAKRVHSLPIGVRLPIGRYGPRDCSDYLEIERHPDFYELILRTDSGEWFRRRFNSDAEVIAAGIHERTLLNRHNPQYAFANRVICNLRLRSVAVRPKGN